MANEVLSRGITLGYKKSSAYEIIAGLKEIPEMGATSEKVDVTDLSDASKRYINGIIDYGDLTFKFNYDNSSETSNYRVLKALKEAGKPVDFQVTFPDDTGFAFSGQVVVKTDSAGVNAALTFVLSITLNSAIATTHPTAV